MAKKIRFETSLGAIVVELNEEKAPVSCESVLAYAESGHYDELLFHRVIDGFVIQGGGYDKDLKKRPPREPIKNEAKNGLKNVVGAVAMARTPDIDSATSQFFINVEDNPFLDHKDDTPEGYGYAVFGQVVEGMDTVNKIKKVETGKRGSFEKDCPLEDVVIKEVTIL